MARPVNNKSHKPHRRDQQPPAHSGRTPTVWGLHAFRDAWLNPDRHVKSAWLTRAAAESLGDALTGKSVKRPQPEIVDMADFKGLFREGEASVHQGACLWGEPLEQPMFEDWLKTGPKRVVILDQVTDPHNVGAIMRSACAFGFDGMIMQDRHAPPVTGTLAKVACGAVDHLPLISVVNISRAIDTLKEHGFFAIGLAEEESVPFASLPSYEKLALVMGNEGDGLREGVRKSCDVCAALPTTGPIRSLNVSAAASAALMALVK